MAWTVALQDPLSLEFSSQEYWSGLPFPSPGRLSNPGIEPGSPALLQADSLPSEPEREFYYFTITSIVVVVVNQTTGAGRTLG